VMSFRICVERLTLVISPLYHWQLFSQSPQGVPKPLGCPQASRASPTPQGVPSAMCPPGPAAFPVKSRFTTNPGNRFNALPVCQVNGHRGYTPMESHGVRAPGGRATF